MQSHKKEKRQLTEQQQERKDRNGSLRIRPFDCVEMVKVIRSLSSGTVSRLCGSSKYEDIDEYTKGWVSWVLMQEYHPRWRTWQECNQDYEDSKKELLKRDFLIQETELPEWRD